MILAAGRGERMRPLTDTCPKPMLKVGGQPLLFFHLQKLANAGVRDVVINHAWLGQHMQNAIGDGRDFGVQVHWSAEPAGGLETAGGIIQALPLLGDEPFIVVNGDVWSDLDYARLPQLGATDLGHLVLVKNPAHHPAGDFSLLKDRVTQPSAPTTYTFAGLSVLSPRLFAGLDSTARKLKPLFDQAITTEQLGGQVHQGAWWDVGTPARLDELDTWLGGRTEKEST